MRELRSFVFLALLKATTAFLSFSSKNHEQLTPLCAKSSNSVDSERRFVLTQAGVAGAMILSSFPSLASAAATSGKKCTDIETCREIGDQRIEQDLKENPVTRLDSGVRFKTVQPGVGSETVKEGASIDMIYSISRAGGQYMYSQGFGYEMIDLGDGKLQKDLGLDFLRVTSVGGHSIPIGIEQALVGMKKGERRRVEVPPSVGFDTSNWEPSPQSRAGKQSIVAYQRILKGFGSQPPFPAPLVWDIEVTRIRN